MLQITACCQTGSLTLKSPHLLYLLIPKKRLWCTCPPDGWHQTTRRNWLTELPGLAVCLVEQLWDTPEFTSGISGPLRSRLHPSMPPWGSVSPWRAGMQLWDGHPRCKCPHPEQPAYSGGVNLTSCFQAVPLGPGPLAQAS